MRTTRGRPAVAEDFFGREPDLTRLLHLLASDNALLLAPRRVGKTSLLHALSERWRAEKGRALYLDLQGAMSERDVPRRLGEAVSGLGDKGLVATASARIGKALAHVGAIGGSAAGFGLDLKLRDLPDGDWALAVDGLVRSVAEGSELLVLIDELPLLVQHLLAQDEGARRARTFLDGLRKLRLDPTLRHVHWLVAGSIGLDTLARRHGFTASINDFVIASLGAFDHPTAKALLDALARGHGASIDEAARDHIVSRLDWCLPYYVQIHFDEARHAGEAGHIDVLAVDAAWRTLLDAHHRTHFDHWYTRLADGLAPADADRAYALLHAASDRTMGLDRDEARALVLGGTTTADLRDRWAWLVDVLVVDGYLVADGPRLRFRSPLLREFWRERTR